MSENFANVRKLSFASLKIPLINIRFMRVISIRFRLVSDFTKALACNFAFLALRTNALIPVVSFSTPAAATRNGILASVPVICKAVLPTDFMAEPNRDHILIFSSVGAPPPGLFDMAPAACARASCAALRRSVAASRSRVVVAAATASCAVRTFKRACARAS